MALSDQNCKKSVKWLQPWCNVLMETSIHSNRIATNRSLIAQNIREFYQKLSTIGTYYPTEAPYYPIQNHRKFRHWKSVWKPLNCMKNKIALEKFRSKMGGVVLKHAVLWKTEYQMQNAEAILFFEMETIWTIENYRLISFVWDFLKNINVQVN